MAKISQIALKNIKFFHNETIRINKNILFYGENGSGKSSLFWALKVHFEHLTGIISDDDKDEFFNAQNPKNLRNRNYPGDECSIVITPHDIVTSKDSIHFINHQLLAKLFSFDIDGTANFFNVLTDDLMSKYSLFSELKEIIGNVTKNAQENNIEDIENNIILYQEKLVIILQNIGDKANIIISEKFDESLFQITLSIVENPSSKDTYLGYYKIEDPKIILQVNQISNPQHHFNEAKLKLISLAIYFAIIELSKPNEDYNGLRLAVFDDFLQSLDMSYRDVVLDYIFQNFQNYQIIMMTHDLQFFKLLKRKTELYNVVNNWEYKNIYIRESTTDQTAKIEPVVYDFKGGDNYLQTAKKALLSNDFETCGNNCRKELEKIIVNLALDLQIGLRGQLKDFLELFKKREYTHYYFSPQEVIKTLLERGTEPDTFSKVNLGQLRECLRKSEFYTNIVLNPSSHDNEGERYKREFESIIKNIEELKQITQQ